VCSCCQHSLRMFGHSWTHNYSWCLLSRASQLHRT
jgi:hypothetical protein